jgi:hypothetical protein
MLERPAHEARTGDGPVGLVLVHGIGTQRQGEFSELVLEGLFRAHEKPDVRVYEAWWADILQGEAVRDSFDRWSVQSVAWFPWLNLRARLLRGRSRISPLVWTIVLARLALTLQVGLTVARRSAFVASYLDEKAADVFNYVDSADGAVDADLPRAVAARCAEQRLVAALEQARQDGCGDIQIIAHSLGSVIAYRVLAGLHGGAPAPEVGRLVTRLYTLGSPLEKFALVWPRLVPVGDAAGSTLRWDNFDDPLDPIGGSIRHFDGWCRVENHRVAGREGLRTAPAAT